MIITAEALKGITTGFSMAFNKGFEGADPLWPKIAMKAPSMTSEEHYGWLNTLPGMREWIGPRLIKNLTTSGYTIVNRIFEDTIGVPRTRIEDDSYGLFAPMFEELGRVAAEQPDKLVADALLGGFTNACFDGQYFFDADHPVVINDALDVVSVSNVQPGAGEPWFLMDTSRAMRPFIWQERIPFNGLVRKDQENDDNVFFLDEYLYGLRGRGNAGYGLWQLAFGSKDTLNAANYEAARVAMQSYVGEHGRKLGIRPTTLLVGPTNEAAARKLINSEYATAGETNPWKGTAELIVSPWVS